MEEHCRIAGLADLRFIEDVLRYLIGKNLWRSRSLQNLILTKGQKALEEVLGQRKANDDLLPREQRPI